MAIIEEVNFNQKLITFKCKSIEIEKLKLATDYNFIDMSDLDLNFKIVKRGSTESTMYLLLNNVIKELIMTNYKNELLTKNNIIIKGGIIKTSHKKLLVIEL